jgi:hypothetical protein
MKVYTVTKRGGAKDLEFEAYIRLLEEKGIDIIDMPRVLESGTPNRWVYVWESKDEAREFAEDLRKRTKDRNWIVHEFDTEKPKLGKGPLGPLEVMVSRHSDGFSFALHPFSEELVKRKYPQANTVPSIFIRWDTRTDFEQQYPGTLMDHVAMILTGLQLEEIEEFAGYRVYDPVSKKVFKEAATA